MESINFFLFTDISIGIGLFEKASDFIKKHGAKKPGIIIDANMQDNMENNISMLFNYGTNHFTFGGLRNTQCDMI